LFLFRGIRPIRGLKMDRKLVVGLVGGIGSGKSRVAGAFAERGACVIDGDRIAHEALREPDVIGQVIARWGKDLLDGQGQIQRRKLAAIVFAQPTERRSLEAIMHPRIKERIRAEVERAQADPSVRFIVLDAAVMLEAGWHDVCQRLIYLDTPRDLRLQRLAQQRGWTVEEVEARENAQLPLTWKATKADYVVNNSGSLEHLHHQVDALLRLWGLVPQPAADTFDT
jgi:dephospho-CoA kinase